MFRLQEWFYPPVRNFEWPLQALSDSLQKAEKMCENALNFINGEHIYIRHDIGTSKLINKKMENVKNLNIV